ncbi:hypothetical protein A1O7_00707 [Cladophialophora yegresii CBS 114405]|uniref:Uncharacterized protein n=1 Tax=Cladophialophora yegresii CBS 114405 TaxID=1182544 RepID=W9WIF5_9EURO|nr:uncharacterized protein A1O7_00707 [Cladophialophora yegresii CBS 114405]EXJ64371.1 hypothetical protein A1O7_00707 [Cladophialophora yegresii CBS 114405]
MAGLAKTYYDAKLLPDAIVFRQFVQGFNKEHALCHFTDAGDDKEAADNKVKAEMALFYDNVHCKHIMLAASGDNSYAGFLRQYTLTDQVSSRVVLIESIPFANQLDVLAIKFEKTHLQGLFRDHKIEKKALLFHEERPGPLGDTPPATYASTVKQPNGWQEKQAPVLPKSPLIDGGQVEAGRRIYQNNKGQRVDQPIKADKATTYRLKPLKLCNRHFLTKCYHNPCGHNHEGKLTSVEIDALRFIARLSPCQTLYCEDPDCVSGHRCMQGANCDKGSRCWFGDEMHRVDTKITGFITV